MKTLTQPRSRFRKELLPSPASFYERQFGQLRRPSHSGWTTVRCCFHDPDRHPSLRVNVITGAFKCFSCGAHGGDLISFVRQLHGLTFKEACVRLNCWDDSSPSRRRSQHPRPSIPQPPAPPAVEEPRPLHLSLWDRLNKLENSYREASARLCELHRAGRGDTLEADACWKQLTELLPAIRECEAAYFQAAGITTEGMDDLIWKPRTLRETAYK